jgi:hypothetical protein
MVDPSFIISALITGAQQLQELYDQKGKNDIDCKDHMDKLDANLKTLKSLQDRLKNQLMTLNKKDMEMWTEKKEAVEKSLDEFTKWINERKKQCWIRRVLCSAGQSDDIRNLVGRFNNRFQDFNNFLKGIVDCEKVYCLQQIVENTVIITLPFQI